MKQSSLSFLSLLFLVLILNTKGLSCGNEYGYTLKGERMYTRYFFLTEAMRHFDTLKIKGYLNKLNIQIQDDPTDFKNWSDIALNLMKLGKADSSIKILKPLLRVHPLEYNLIANLGTAYELVGELDSALKYISKGYRLNPKSHIGSEWIHVKILEAKIKTRSNGGWIYQNPILDIEGIIDTLKTKKNPRSYLRKINGNIFYQLRTRAPFTPAPNAVMGNLLNSLGDLNKREGAYENAILAYIYALEFYSNVYRKTKEVVKKIKQLNQLNFEQESKHELSYFFMNRLKRSQIDPQLLVLGINDIGEELDSIHQSQQTKDDTLKLLKLKIDSLENFTITEELRMNEEFDSKNDDLVFYGFAGIALLIGLSMGLVIRRKRKS